MNMMTCNLLSCALHIIKLNSLSGTEKKEYDEFSGSPFLLMLHRGNLNLLRATQNLPEFMKVTHNLPELIKVTQNLPEFVKVTQSQ